MVILHPCGNIFCLSGVVSKLIVVILHVEYCLSGHVVSAL